MQSAAADAVGFKIGGGLPLRAQAPDPARPERAEVEAAAGKWLREIDAGEPVRVTDQVLIRHGIWAALDTGLPLQFTSGYGDTDSRLPTPIRRCCTTSWLASQPTGTPVMLLHCYPYHRQAGSDGRPVPARVHGRRRGT